MGDMASPSIRYNNLRHFVNQYQISFDMHGNYEAIESRIRSAVAPPEYLPDLNVCYIDKNKLFLIFHEKIIAKTTLSMVVLAYEYFSGKTRVLNEMCIEDMHDEAQAECELNCLEKLKNVPGFIHAKGYFVYYRDQKKYRGVFYKYYVDGDLFKLVKDRTIDVELVFRSLVERVETLHNLSIVHRDLKWENMYWSRTKGLIVADFGLAFISPNPEQEQYVVGTLGYIPPEVLRKYTNQIIRVGFCNDVWLVGILGFTAINGFLPTVCSEVTPELCKDFVEAYNNMTRLESFTVRYKPTNKIEEIIKQCLTFDEMQRPNIQTLAQQLKPLPEPNPQMEKTKGCCILQ